MEYAAEKQYQGIAGGMVGGQLGQAVRAQSTLASRLENACKIIEGQSRRIEDAIARINGAERVQTPDAPKGITATVPLARSVQYAEELGKRLAEIASSMDQIA